MKTTIATLLSICFVVSNTIIVGAVHQRGNVSQHQPILSNHFSYDEQYDLLIITPDELQEDFEPLKTHKESKGIHTTIVGLNEIYNGIYFPAEGRDDAENIKYFIKNAKDNWHTRYVMLVGGKNDMPVRYVHGPSTMPSVDDKLISDLYYADIYDENGSFCSWDSNNNNVFGEMEEMSIIDYVDLYPDVYIGRILCSNSTDVDIVVDKIINYENNVYSESWLNNIVLCGGDTHPTLYDEIVLMILFFSMYNILCRVAWEGEFICEEISKIMNGYNTMKCYASGFIRPNAKRLTVDNINNAINDGCKFFVFSGHGSPSSFATHLPFSQYLMAPFPLGYSSSDIQHLDNNERLPITIFNACSCGDFSTIASPIAWEFIIHENGGSIGSLACTTYSWGPSTSLISSTFNGFLTIEVMRLYSEGIDILGELWGSSISNYLDDENPMASYMNDWQHNACLEEWILFGDPSLKIGGYE